MYKLLLTLFAAVLFAASVPVEPSFIAFASNRDGNYEIYVMNEDGTDQKNLTCSPGNDRDPAWSFDGEKIAFTSDRDGNYEIYIMDADGSNQKRLTFSPGSDRYPAWSPDGDHIVFTTDRDTNDEIYVINVKKKTLERLTRNLSFDARPTWSPNGEKIVYDSSGLYQNRYPYDIYTMDTDGSNKTNLTNYIDRNSDPAWSFDGKKIAFVKRLEGSYNIFVMDVDGKNQVNVTNNPSGNWDPAWSPDTKKIVFASDRQITKAPSSTREQSLQPTPVDPPRDIYVIDLTEKTLKRLTNDELTPDDDIIDDTYPSWCLKKEKVNFPRYAAFFAIAMVLAAIFLKKSLNRN